MFYFFFLLITSKYNKKGLIVFNKKVVFTINLKIIKLFSFFKAFLFQIKFIIDILTLI